MRNDILNALDKIGKDNNCHVLFACESGSRAWGFESPDSDYDVRFIYYNSIDWYLSIDDHPDTINAMLPHDLDLCGWELKKAMKLFSKSNFCLFEWLNSPEIYLRNKQFHDALKKLISDYFIPNKALYHYLGTANKVKEKYLVSPKVNIKKLFYVIRPLLAAYWVINNKTMPPTEFNQLYAKESLPDFICKYIDDFLIKKSQASEKDAIVLPGKFSNWIEMTLLNINVSIGKLDSTKKIDFEPLNKIISTIFATEFN